MRFQLRVIVVENGARNYRSGNSASSSKGLFARNKAVGDVLKVKISNLKVGKRGGKVDIYLVFAKKGQVKKDFDGFSIGSHEN